MKLLTKTIGAIFGVVSAIFGLFAGGVIFSAFMAGLLVFPVIMLRWIGLL